MNKETTPFTYLIGWSLYNKFYYGVRYAKNTDPTSLWKSYFTSSKAVKSFRAAFGEPDVIQIRKIFQNKEEAKTWEIRVLCRLNVPKNKKFLNMTRNLKPDSTPKDGVRNGFFGKKHSPETIAKMKASHRHIPTWLGRKHSEETKAKISIASSKYRASEETKIKIGLASKGRKASLGKKHSEETKAKMRKAKMHPSEEVLTVM